MEKQFLPETIKGERITLKRHKLELAQQMFDYVVEDRERLTIFLPWVNSIKTIDDEIEYINRCDNSWENHSESNYGLYRNSDDEYMGNIGCFEFNWNHHSCKIGYWILGSFEGNGFISEATTLLEKTLFEIGFNRLVIKCDPQNSRSSSIPKRLNYHLEGTQREVHFENGKYVDLEVYSKLRKDVTL